MDIHDVILVDENTIKLLIPELNSSIDPQFFKRVIITEQERQIRPLLGYDFYNSILDGIKNNSTSTVDKYLLDNYLVMLLSLYVYKRIILSTSYQIENTGLRKKNSDNSELASEKEIDYIRKQIDQDILFYLDEMEKYLIANQTDYLLYFNRSDSRNNSNDIEKRKNYFGFSFGAI